ncbi:MAG: hypothetical protein E6I28_06525 [Chloroflexi bacterium]|nr:MAG: hypothetical protein E6I28_06525 [Chloroflexota bacterium]
MPFRSAGAAGVIEKLSGRTQSSTSCPAVTVTSGGRRTCARCVPNVTVTVVSASSETRAGTRLTAPTKSARKAVLGNEPRELGGARVRALPVRHIRLAEPHGLRVEVDGKVIAYSGDARWSEELIPIADGADLFICEASYFDRDDPAHISYRQLMAHRHELGARRIVLTHLGAETLAHLAEVELEHAVDGTSLEV